MVLSGLWQKVSCGSRVSRWPACRAIPCLCLAFSFAALAADAPPIAASVETRPSVVLDRPGIWSSILGGRPVRVGDGASENTSIIGVTLTASLLPAANSDRGSRASAPLPPLMVRAVLDDSSVPALPGIPVITSTSGDEVHYSFLLTNVSGEKAPHAVDIQVRLECGGAPALQIGTSTVTVSPILPGQDPHKHVLF